MPEPMRQGLSSAEVAKARSTCGWNELPKDGALRWPAVLLLQFTGLLVLILVAAAAVALAVGETIDAIAIGLVVVLNGIFGFVQEWRAEKAVAALRDMLSPTALVLRDGEEVTIPARELVPGDLVILSTGDRVPADLKLVRATSLRIDESILTGESVPIDKGPDQVRDGSLAFAGTNVVAGRAEGAVKAIGLDTAFGQIARLTGDVEETQTHLQAQISRLATQLGAAALGVGLAILGVGIFLGRPWLEMFMTGLSLAVAMVPEGLPAVVTITLALGAGAMVRQKALVRRLQSVETLGAASVICTDKTGTLTENKMTAVEVWTSESTLHVTGTGYDPTGHIADGTRRLRADQSSVLKALLGVALSCTHATLSRRDDTWVMTGEPTEGALVTLAYKGWAAKPDPDSRLVEIAFSSERKRMSVLVREGGGWRLDTKGAPEVILGLSDSVLSAAGPVALTEAERARIVEAYEAMAGRGLRVIALAQRPAASDSDLGEAGFIFLGLVGLLDPPRSEVKLAIAAARKAGISIVMITGDSPVTARAIAEALELPVARCLTGQDIETADPGALDEAITPQTLFARTKPDHKMRIVEALQARGQIVAMTGDGVNDAPALKRADIGIAMGQRGTEVSKEAADLILLDDNFGTIVRAIGEGRRQFDNIRKFVRYLLASNAGEVVAIVTNLLLGGPLVFLATQILWMNLVTDGITAVALGLERGDPDQMERPPRGMDEPLLGTRGFGTIAIFGLYTASASLMLFYTFLPQGEDLARTVAFTGMIAFEKVSVFAFRSLTRPCWQIGWLSNRFLIAALMSTFALQVAAVYFGPLQVLLHTVPIAVSHWAWIGVLCVPLVVGPEIVKSVRSRRTVRAL